MAVGHCLVPRGPVSDIGVSLGQESLPTSLLAIPIVRRFRGRLHSEYEWPGFRLLGCNRRVSARFVADESEVAT